MAARGHSSSPLAPLVADTDHRRFEFSLEVSVALLIQFAYRLSFGMALAMALTSPRYVTGGYYRNHLYVLLGLGVLATLIALWNPGSYALWPPIAVALLSYAGSVFWLYEKAGPGILALLLVSFVALFGAWQAHPGATGEGALGDVYAWFDPATAGLLLGSTMAAMLLGHWYLNSPGMQLLPLRRLVILMTVAIALRAALCASSVVLTEAGFSTDRLLFFGLRWVSGLLGTLGLAWMTWQTLKIPNTQSATGILYVAVSSTILGELTSLLLTGNSVYPL
jgi:hypothetical protein